MSASLVGSEMCIRDSLSTKAAAHATHARTHAHTQARSRASSYACEHTSACLLYTSDAADDM
eukprot:8057514-Alexandrium_andersonii.AAC.1